MQNSLRKISLRMKLNDFINKKVEDDILKGLAEITQISNGIVSLILWFDEKDSDINLKETIESIGDAHHWKTNIVAKSKIKESDFVWFDMRSYDDEYEIPQNFRFQYKYGTPSQIVNGLKTFSDAITFFKNKPAKENKIERKQKRNDI
jgi:hypothetical protein|tara:strand:+ start:802 stop:1245 length:444 start_codon:yes stop_codon:yes gene_type:complete